jgi:hypothetical protein
MDINPACCFGMPVAVGVRLFGVIRRQAVPLLDLWLPSSSYCHRFATAPGPLEFGHLVNSKNVTDSSLDSTQIDENRC